MKKSQLRLLASDVANGRITADEYRTRRRELIDNIVAGSEPIERVHRQALDTGDEQATMLDDHYGRGKPQQSRAAWIPLPIPVLLAAGSVLCAGVLAALLWPEPAPPVAKLTPPTVPTAHEIPQVRALVESFVARRDFSAAAIDAFSRDWERIDAHEREQARGEWWFVSLVSALRNEVNVQKALAGLGAGESALKRARAAFAMGELLGVSDELPRVDKLTVPSIAMSGIDASLANSEREAVAPPTPTTTGEPAAMVPAFVPATSTAASPSAAATARQWLAAQADEQLTLQIFAVNNLDRVRQLIAKHPDVAVHVLTTDGAAPRYRVLHGVFTNEERARQAYATLPASITTASNGAIVKSFSVVRDDLRATASSSAPTPVAAPTAANVFTLQVFATGNRSSAQALVQAFPALNLQLREVSGDVAPYRVVHGDYASVDEARSAAATLPRDLLARIGTPLLKSIAALGSAASR